MKLTIQRFNYSKRECILSYVYFGSGRILWSSVILSLIRENNMSVNIFIPIQYFHTPWCRQFHSLIYSNIMLLSYTSVCYTSLTLLNKSSNPFPTNFLYICTILVIPSLSALLVYTCTGIDPPWPCPNVFSTRLVTCSILAPGRQITCSTLYNVLFIFRKMESPIHTIYVPSSNRTSAKLCWVT